MANQGPLVRVDTDGRGNFLKLTRAQADAYVAIHPGAKLVGVVVASVGTVPDGPDLGVAIGGFEEPDGDETELEPIPKAKASHGKA